MLGKLTLGGRIEKAKRTRFDPNPHLDDVLRYAFFRLGSREDAEDITAQVRHEVLRLPAIQNPRLYMIGMARRKVANHLRRQARSPKARSLDDPGFAPPGAPDDFDAIHRREAVSAVLRRLPDDQREVLAMKYLVGLSASEIANVTDRTPVAVNSLLQRAREAFANEAGDQFSEEIR